MFPETELNIKKYYQCVSPKCIDIISYSPAINFVTICIKLKLVNR